MDENKLRNAIAAALNGFSAFNDEQKKAIIEAIVAALKTVK